MKKSRFSDEQITYALRQVEAGTPPADVCRQLGITAYDTESGDLLTPASKPPVPPPLEEDELPKRKWWRRRG